MLSLTNNLARFCLPACIKYQKAKYGAIVLALIILQSGVILTFNITNIIEHGLFAGIIIEPNRFNAILYDKPSLCACISEPKTLRIGSHNNFMKAKKALSRLEGKWNEVLLTFYLIILYLSCLEQFK